MTDNPSTCDAKIATTTRVTWIRLTLPLFLGIGLSLSAGCIPVRYAYWTESVKSSPEAQCNVSDGELVCYAAGDVAIAVINPSTAPIVEAAGLTLEIPEGHVARLSGDTAVIMLADGSASRTLRIVSTSGFRYKDEYSLERIADAYGDAATRDLVGSTFRSHRSSEKLHSLYHFDIVTEGSYPETFELQLPDIIVDGTTIAMPRLSFQYGTHTKVKGLFGV